MANKRSQKREAYLKAIDLIPYSEGPVAGADPSFYLGIVDKDTKPLAKEALEKLANERPNDPGVYYALGELMFDQDDAASAFANYEAAVKADPQYLRAWAAISDLAAEGVMTNGQAMEAFYALSKLDRSTFRGAAALAVGDFAAIYTTYQYNMDHPLNAVPKDLYPLQASTASLAVGAPAYEPENRTPETGGDYLGSLEELQALFPR